MKTAVERDADILDGVGNGSFEEVAAQGASQPNARAGERFVIDAIRAEVIQLPMEDRNIQSQLAPEQPRLGELRLVILLLGPQGDVQPKFLAAPGERGRMEQIK